MEESHIPFEGPKQRSERKLSCLPTESVDIQKKYNAELTVKLNALKECENIEAYRQHMLRLENRRWNNIDRSPNFLKMNYLISRAKEEEK